MPGRYEVVGTLASGGMAEISLARVAGPEGFSRAVALKRVRPNLAKNAAFRTMFLDEARLMAGIHHSNVVNVHELYEADDELFLVMDYLEGETAAGLLRAAVAAERELPAELMAYVVAEASAGLHAAHEMTDAEGNPLGLVHRDVSPQNIFITYDGHVLLLDFGIAHAAGRGTHTEAGQIKGKFAYMSPEQCRGKILDRRSDVFALGILLYELSTGRHLFKRDSDMRTMRAVCKEAAPDPATLVDGYPTALAKVCLHALAKSRDQRPRTAEELEATLRTQIALPNPRAALAELMSELFGERIAEKREMMRALRSGRAEVSVAEAETHVGVMIPTVPEGPHPESVVTASTKPSRWPLAIAALALAAVVAGVSVTAMREPEPPPATTVEEVSIRVETTPAGATVRIAGKDVGTTPIDLPMAVSDDAQSVVVSLAGYDTLSETVVPNVSQRLRLTLTPVRSASASASAPPKAPPPPATLPKRPPPKPPAKPSASAKSKYYQL